MITVLDNKRMEHTKRAFITRNVPIEKMHLVASNGLQPKSGDLVLAKVARLGNQSELELISGRHAQLHEGDEIIVAYGNRYAADQYEATTPGNLGPCDLVSPSGIASKALNWSSKVTAPTQIVPIGLLVNSQHQAINLSNFSINVAPPSKYPHVIAVVGSAMNSGKTTTAANLIHGLKHHGHVVGAAKLTGTGTGDDLWKMKDAGASQVLDFTDVGYASTFKTPLPQLEHIAKQLLGELSNSGCTVIVVEIADGIYQQETAALIQSGALKQIIDGYVYTAESAASAVAGVQWLQNYGEIFAISGVVSASPLASLETEAVTGLPCLTRQLLALGSQQSQWLKPRMSELQYETA